MAGKFGKKQRRIKNILLVLLIAALIGGAGFSAGLFVIAPAVAARTGVSAVSQQSTASVSSVASSAASSQADSSAASSSAAAGSYEYFADAVFIGDSLTSGIDIYNVADNKGVFASNGMSTSTALTKKVSVGSENLTVTEAVKKAAPAKIYVMLGANDLTYMSKSTYIANYGKLIDKLKSSAAGAIIYVQSILPVTADYEKSTGITNDKIDTYNAALSSLCSEKGVKYTDVAAAFKDSGGKLPKTYSSSGFNITKSSYKVWFDYLTLHE